MVLNLHTQIFSQQNTEKVPRDVTAQLSLRSRLHCETEMRFCAADGGNITLLRSTRWVLPLSSLIVMEMVPIPSAGSVPAIPLTPVFGSGDISEVKKDFSAQT